MKKLILIVGVSLLCGCASYTSQTEQFRSQWVAGNTEVAAQIATKEADERADTRDAIVWRLEQGAALRADGQYDESNRAFEKAEDQIKYFREDAARVRGGKEAVSAVTNLAAVPYEGYGYDRVMLHTYKALNYLQIGDKQGAKVEFKRAENAQENENERNIKRLEKAKVEVRKNKDVSLAKANSEGKLDVIQPDIEMDYGDFGNPFKDYIHALFLIAEMNNNARLVLRRVNSTLGGVALIEEEYKFVDEVLLNGKDYAPRTYVIYESGLAPVREEVRIDIPLMIENVPYVAAAFPKLVNQGQSSSMTVSAGGKTYSSVRLCSMDAIIAREFKTELPGVIARTLVSAAIKAAATKVASDKGGDIGRLVGMLYQAGSTQADLRTWSALPKEFHVCRFDTPSDRAISISTSGGATAGVTVDDAQISIVYVKDFGPNTLLKINQFLLK